MFLTSRPLRILLRIFLALLIALSVLLATAFYFLQRNPEALTLHYLDELSARTGLTFTVESVDVVLLPVPSIVMSNASVEGKELLFSVAYATLRPDFLALLRGAFEPRDISLVRPCLRGVLPLPLGDPGALAARFGGSGGGLPDLLTDCRMAIVQGEADLTGTDGARLQLGSLQCRLDTESPARVSGRVHLGAALLRRQGAPLIRLDNFLVEGESDPRRPLTATPKLLISGALRWPPHLERFKLALNFQAGVTGWAARADLNGELAKDQELLPFALAGTAAVRGREQNVSLERVQLEFGPDSGELSGMLRLPGTASGAEQGFSLDGRLLLHRASLTQWLGFARNLAPGLQLALDNLTDGSMDFHLDGQGLKVPRIAVRCAGARFTGSGGVASWAKPEVALDLKADRLNLGLAIPEAVGKPPLGPRFFHGPLTPMPGEPLQPGETGVNYDIRLAAAGVDYGLLRIEDAKVVIRPGKMDKNGLEDTLLAADGRFYGGSIHGECILGGGKEHPYAISMRFRDVNGAPLGKTMPALPVKSGRLRADVDIMSQGRELAGFLGKLRGTVSVRGERGSLRPPGSSGELAFSGMEVELRARSAVWEKGRLGLDGQWRGALDSADLNGQADLNGRLWFSGDGGGNGNLDFQNLPGNLTLRLSPALSSLPEGLQADLSGDFSCQGARNQLAVGNAHASALGVELRGQAQVSGSRDGLGWQGSVSAIIRDLNRTLRLAFNTAAKLPPALNKLSLEADFKGSSDTLSLSNIRARLDQSAVGGSLTASLRKPQPDLNFNLGMDKLNLNRYLDDKKDAPAKKGAPKPSGEKWNFRFMRGFSAKGELRVKELTGWRFKAQDIKLPFMLENGLLNCGPNTASFYGAALQGRAKIDFNKGLRFESSLAVTDFDLTAASRDRGGDAVLGGRGSISSEVRGALTGPGQLPAALDGAWRFIVRDGSYQKRGGDGGLKGRPTLFGLASASGSITAGMVRSADFSLQGPGLKVHGGGWIDPNNETLDCNFTVNMKNLPDFPLRLYGSLHDSKTSIGAGKLILNTIGGITSGFVDVLGGIVEGTWKLFR
ncbi:AsmA-like C-terminal region-containing protein [uncultured Desulfovibrio sp.]|uniref:AsmA family protein n=1 Tax=uncultured Desulfovibrio sp. TaxID=167968 RepID=UPI0026276333|nr:AsmA-like C-terminal region-containing protein [uncultured Desulfovibrio sp.]